MTRIHKLYRFNNTIKVKQSTIKYRFYLRFDDFSYDP